MDTRLYDIILSKLKEYNELSGEENFGNDIVPYPSTNSKYPYTVFDEVRNVANHIFGNAYDRLSSVGYRVDIYAKTKGKYTKQHIARHIAEKVDYFLTYVVGLKQVSWNKEEIENEASIYHIIITYTGNLYENRRRLL